MNFDLACGLHPRPGYTGIDIASMPIEGYWKYDLTKYPWEWAPHDSSVNNLHCSHYVEHVADLIAFMNECWRILIPDGELFIIHPYQHSNRAWQDPTHVRALNEDSWRYYNLKERQAMGVDHYPITANFEIVNIDFIVPAGTNPSRNDVRFKVNVVDDLQVTLRAIK